MGILIGGAVSDRWRRTRIAGRLYAMAMSMALTVPCSYLALRGPDVTFIPACLLNMFFISWYHGPMAATIDDLAPPGMAATAQGLVIFFMHAVGTSLGIYSVGLLADSYRLSTALMLPLVAIIFAAVAMMRSTGRFVTHMEGATT
ncbi:MAG: hypothetical protein IPL79_04850 [Myxococcales bacterium]|nr:hypothetical protein [Myxococcales bacterium]